MRGRIVFALAALLLLVGGCGSDEPEGSTPPDQTQPQTTVDSGPEIQFEERDVYEVWLADRDFLRLGWRPGGDTNPLDILLSEQSLTAVPAGTQTLGIDAEGETLTVDLSEEFGVRGPRLRVAQVVYTVTQFESFGSVEILVDGEPLEDLPGPHTRDDFEEDLAPVIVESPTGLEPVTSPIVVSGTANTFEANVLISVLGDLGQELASTFTTATCGSGCRGEFEQAVEVSVPAEQSVTLVVSEEDASSGEGRPPYSLEIPLILRP
jgi:Immunoglobulin-like domain of bacterial spore germination/Sporulation and spore germination